MKIYVAHTYGVVFRDPDTKEDEHGDIIMSRHTTPEGAQRACLESFLAEPLKTQAPWRKDVVVWHQSRDSHRELSLWSLLPEAAPAMGDPNRSFYPQMRETSFWVETLDVVEDVPEPPEYPDGPPLEPLPKGGKDAKS